MVAAQPRTHVLHVEDVARAYVLLLERGKSGGVYNVCSGRAVPLGDYAQFLARQARVPIRFKTRPEKMRRFDAPVTCGSPARLRALGWRPRRSVYDALRELLEYWRTKIR